MLAKHGKPNAISHPSSFAYLLGGNFENRLEKNSSLLHTRKSGWLLLKFGPYEGAVEVFLAVID